MSAVRQYLRPASVPEAVRMVREGAGKGGYIAGGTGLGSARLLPYEYLVDITALELGEIYISNRQVHIGATVTIQQLAAFVPSRMAELDFLGQAARAVATLQIRNMATVGGDVVSGYPAADLPPAFLVLDARLRLAGAEQEEIALRDFCGSPSSRAIGDSLVTGIIFPIPPMGAKGCFLKQARTENDVAIVDLACLVSWRDGRFDDVRLALSCATPQPLRLMNVEEFLTGQRPHPDVLLRAAQLAVEDLPILDTVRASRGHRRQLIQTLVPRALRACLLQEDQER